MERQPEKHVTEDFPEEIIFESKDLDENKAKDQGQSFESDEHRDIGNFSMYYFLSKLSESDVHAKKIKTIFLKILEESEVKEIHNPFKNQSEKIHVYNLKINDSLSVTPGAIVALAGDFFGIPEQPIAFGKDLVEQKARFTLALNTLIADDKTTQDKIKHLLDHIEDDARAKSPHAHWTLKFKKTMKNTLPIPMLPISDIQYAVEMTTEESGFWHSPYFELALNNFDHFGNEAKVAWLAGHHLAIEKAQQAGESNQTAEKQKELLGEALLHELFACHFLTDLFAAGHIRVPRKQLLNYLTQNTSNSSGISALDTTPDLANISQLNLTIAGFFARKMHDEDGNKGVWVSKTTEEGKIDSEVWKALGDGNYYNDDNQRNAQKVCELMVIALNDLVLAFKQQTTVLDKHIDKYLPKPKEDHRFQTKPMFYVEGGHLYCRGDLFKEIKDQGVLKGLKQGLPCIPEHMATISCRFFNVKVKPAAKAVAEHSVTYATKATEKVEELVELTEDKAKELYEKMRQIGRPTCNII